MGPHASGGSYITSGHSIPNNPNPPLNDRTVALDDKVFRALGLLRSARMVATEEVLLLLSHLRLGVNLGRIKGIDIKTINELFLLTQPAHLRKITGRKLEGDHRRAARADYIRQRLGA